MIPELKLAVVSDIHLGSKRNETEYIISNLDRDFADDLKFAELDLLVLAGDVFDRLLSLGDDCVYSIDAWIIGLLRRCKKHDVMIIVLEGTPSHDRGQSQRFVHLNDEARIGADLHYITELSVEYFPKLDISALFVPDEWEDDPENTLSQVRELMAARGLETVDFAFMHGNFRYQLPPVVKHPCHDADAYHKLVDKFIFIGHIHTFSRYDRIIAQGSFDRLSHGEEEAKGHVRLTIRSRDDYEMQFIENVGARKYVTVNCLNMTLEETLVRVREKTGWLPDGSHVRVLCNKDNPIKVEVDQLMRERPLITWSTKIEKEDGEIDYIEDAELQDEYVPITITRDNIAKLVMTRVMQKSVDPEIHQLADNFLLEMR